MTHSELNERAVAWLRGTMRCNPVLSGIASTSEIPDAIGWATSWKVRGSVLIESKVSTSDFHRNKFKFIRYRAPGMEHDFNFKMHSEARKKLALESGYQQVTVPNMGTFRYFLCPAGVIAPELVQKHYPDHGLLYAKPRGIRVILKAPRREAVNHNAELLLLQFALRHIHFNLLSSGCVVNMCELTKFKGSNGISLPDAAPQIGARNG